ncbi:MULTISPECIES: hypothetical protein [Actinosynnema]|uniref:Integral membrane protein n=2 Tax=Actinosynnema TaxID=40566 RepID=C6WQ86_ACTMD|nr:MULTISPECIES: hypothetical protein [Actinosynnema]ACU36740.1 hypothetical protein Amir_2809 [Actinosynnema mirum DSM 43827]AXX30199.1 hypothetical protein APASM_2834 [Actinosynnema pretiosum subsp. pretiosum]MCP2092140.1 hypothetical protein [Actinosynnema pretiosum]QUF05642.1 hypothetical protein KCV87_05965 [Actinosynnema pretiosum subsp. pretiosum]
MIPLLFLNAVTAVVGVVFAAVAAVHPASLSYSQSPDRGERFYALLHAAKAIPLGLLAASLPLALPGQATMFCLLAAALSQAVDAAIGWSRGSWGMTAVGAASAVVHGVTAAAVA